MTNRLFLLLMVIPAVFIRTLSAQDSNYSMGLGLQVSRESVSFQGLDDIMTTGILEAGQLTGSIDWFDGLRESGGFVASLDYAPIPLGFRFSDSTSQISSGSMYFAAVGYDFSVMPAPFLVLRFGPRIALGVIYASSTSAGSKYTRYHNGFFGGAGAAAEADWYPFDTGNGFLDGLFLFVSGRAYLDFPGFPCGRLEAVSGLGMSLY